MLKKKFIDVEELTLDAYKLGVNIYRSDFRPDFIIGLWRGGSPVGIGVQDCLEYLGMDSDHISIRTSYSGLSSYEDMIGDESNIRIHGLQYVLDTLSNTDSLLIVDDVFSTGLSVKAVLERLAEKTRRNMPEEIRIAAPWYKPGKNRTERVPDYYLYETEDWLVFPYELDGLSMDELREHKPEVLAIIKEVVASHPES
jgi:uncharacterized protein